MQINCLRGNTCHFLLKTNFLSASVLIAFPSLVVCKENKNLNLKLNVSIDKIPFLLWKEVVDKWRFYLEPRVSETLLGIWSPTDK